MVAVLKTQVEELEVIKVMEVTATTPRMFQELLEMLVTMVEQSHTA
jgi:hypothetical protein